MQLENVLVDLLHWSLLVKRRLARNSGLPQNFEK